MGDFKNVNLNRIHHGHHVYAVLYTGIRSHVRYNFSLYSILYMYMHLGHSLYRVAATYMYYMS